MKDADKNAILTANDVRTYFPIRGSFGRIVNQVKAVDGVSLRLYEGETYGLVGETGCGKSTLGRTLIRLLRPVSGSIMLDGKDITNLPDKKLRTIRRKVQMVFQDPYTSLNPRKRAGDILIEALAIHKIGGRTERMYKTMRILEKVGLLPEHFYRFPHEFSGGQRQRIGLARAFILNPKIIICDEPVSALDVSIQSQIINLLRQFQEQDNQTFLFVAHDHCCPV
jgi:peptide/nickel transport system ATP-binding protein/oligopeptide transport system ATP-binding protein